MTILTKRRKLTVIINHILLKSDKSKIALADNCKTIRILENRAIEDSNNNIKIIELDENIKNFELKGDEHFLAVTKSKIYKIDWITGNREIVYSTSVGKFISKFQYDTLMLNDGLYKMLNYEPEKQEMEKDFRITTFLRKPDFILSIGINLKGEYRGRLDVKGSNNSSIFSLPKIPDTFDANSKFGIFAFNSNQVNSSSFVQLIHLETGLLIKSISSPENNNKSIYCHITDKTAEILLANNGSNLVNVYSNDGRFKKSLNIGFQSNSIKILDEMMVVAGFGNEVEIFQELMFKTHSLVF